MPRLLIIDDESSIRVSIKAVFARDEIVVTGAETAEEGLRLAAEQSPELILLDIKLGSRSGLDLFYELRQIAPRSLIIFITGFGTTDTAIEAMKLGAYDYLTKPLDARQLKQVVEQAIRHQPFGARSDDTRRGGSAGGQTGSADRKWTRNASGLQTNRSCRPPGRQRPHSGRERHGQGAGRQGHLSSQPSQPGPFLAINCAAIPESLLESELFGHERGAFTGADRRRIGKFEQCHGGTLFLDEVGDMAPHTQAKLLRLLQDGRFERLGGNESISADVRILAATNQDLDALIGDRQFRKDLYYRLSGVTIALPLLRERQEDIAELAHYFLFRYNRQLGTSVQSISPETLELLQSYRWPGNVRELQNVLRQALIASAGATMLPEFLPSELNETAASDDDEIIESQAVPDTAWLGLWRDFQSWLASGETDLYRRARERFDSLIVLGAMQYVSGNRSQAGKILGLSHVTLRAKLRNMSPFADSPTAHDEDNRVDP